MILTRWGVAPALTGQASGKAPRRGGACEENLFRGSSNGRTPAFEAANRGSSPCPRTSKINLKIILFLATSNLPTITLRKIKESELLLKNSIHFYD